MEINQVVKNFSKVAPDLLRIIEERYLLLNYIAYAQPIGRRLLAQETNFSERIVRTQINLMRESGLVEITKLGIKLTYESEKVLPFLVKSFFYLNKIEELQNFLKEKLNINNIVIVPGNSDIDLSTKEDLGVKSSELFLSRLKTKMIVAVSGGSTVATVARVLKMKKIDITVVPARGGVGEKVEWQANVLAAIIAEKTKGNYHMLHIPDGLMKKTLNFLLANEPDILKVVNLINKAQVALLGIGKADEMADIRNIDKKAKNILKHGAAKGEILGYYCDINGKVIYTTNNVGITLDKLKEISNVIITAGGESKAEAIIAISRATTIKNLVTDEGAALKIKELLKNQEGL